jgi:hypothetical protein
MSRLGKRSRASGLASAAKSRTLHFRPPLHRFLQGAGTLELFHLSTFDFQKLIGEITDHPVAVFQRIDQAGFKLPIDERILADTDTLMVFGLDHLVSEQEAAPKEIAAIREWLKREGTCLMLAPHHDVGFTADAKQRQMGRSQKYKTYCCGVGVAAAFSGVGVAFGCFRASLRVSRPFLRASTRVRRRVFFSGDGVGDALAETAPFAGVGAGVGSAAKTLD